MLEAVLGIYYYQFVITALEVMTFTFYMLVLCHGKKQRRSFWGRLGLVVAAQLLMSVPISMLRTGQDSLSVRIVFEVLLSAQQMGAIFWLYREDLSETLLMFAGILVTKNLSGNAVQVLLNLAGKNDMQTISFFAETVPARDWAIYYALQIALLLLTSYVFRRGERNRNVRLGLSIAYLVTGIALILRCVIQPVIRELQPTSMPFTLCARVLLLLIYALIIAIRAGLLGRKKAETELELTEGLLRQERKRYSEMRDTIEVINMRCHDLKRQLSRVQGKLTAEETDALREAIEIYEGNIKTGNEIVDTVLYGKKLICDKNAIKLTWVCDGAAVRFMEPSQLYSLLDNGLENAIEAVMKLEEDKRLVDICIYSRNGKTVFEITNYFDPAVGAVPGDTSKADKVRHGYGLKSMRYIAGLYGGSAEAKIEDDLFFLTVTIPNTDLS